MWAWFETYCPSLTSPFVATVEGFIYAIPFAVLLVVLRKESYFIQLLKWRFWVFKFGLISILLAVVISMSMQLDGGGTLFSRSIEQW
jgi:hypothetical protein